MIQKLYMQYDTVWHWSPRFSWRPASILSCSGDTAFLVVTSASGCSVFLRTTMCRVRPRDRSMGYIDTPIRSPWDD